MKIFATKPTKQDTFIAIIIFLCGILFYIGMSKFRGIGKGQTKEITQEITQQIKPIKEKSVVSWVTLYHPFRHGLFGTHDMSYIWIRQ